MQHGFYHTARFVGATCGRPHPWGAAPSTIQGDVMFVWGWRLKPCLEASDAATMSACADNDYGCLTGILMRPRLDSGDTGMLH